MGSALESSRFQGGGCNKQRHPERRPNPAPLLADFRIRCSARPCAPERRRVANSVLFGGYTRPMERIEAFGAVVSEWDRQGLAEPIGFPLRISPVEESKCSSLS